MYLEIDEIECLFVMDVYSKMCEMWEYVIEEILFVGVIGCFWLNVVIFKLRVVCVEKVDYEVVYVGMMWCLKYFGYD